MNKPRYPSIVPDPEFRFGERHKQAVDVHSGWKASLVYFVVGTILGVLVLWSPGFFG